MGKNKGILWTPEKKAEVFEEILEYIRGGMSLSKATKQPGTFGWSAFYNYMDTDPELEQKYVRACKVRADFIFDEMQEIADTTEEGIVTVVDENGTKVTKQDMLGHRRLKVDTRKWVLGRLNSTKYGDRIALEHGGEIQYKETVDLSALTTEELKTYYAIKAKIKAASNPGGDADGGRSE